MRKSRKSERKMEYKINACLKIASKLYIKGILKNMHSAHFLLLRLRLTLCKFFKIREVLCFCAI